MLDQPKWVADKYLNPMIPQIFTTLLGLTHGDATAELDDLIHYNNSSDRTPLYLYDSGTQSYLNPDNTIAWVWKCSTLTRSSEKTLTTLLRIPLPEDSVLQFILHSDPVVKPGLNAYSLIRAGSNGPHDQDAVDNYCDVLTQNVSGISQISNIPSRNYRVIVTLKISPTVDTDLNEIVSFTEKTLAGCGLSPELMEPTKLLHLLHRLFNDVVTVERGPDGKSVSHLFNEEMPHNEQIIFTETKIDYHYKPFLNVGNHNDRVMLQAKTDILLRREVIGVFALPQGLKATKINMPEGYKIMDSDSIMNNLPIQATSGSNRAEWMEYEFHPVASLFPLMDDESFRDLCNDVAVNGLIEPIWLYDGKIVDGRNRYLACLQTQTRPIFREWAGTESLVEFIVSLNLRRRHLNSSQRAMIAQRMIPLLEEEGKERQRKAGREHGRGTVKVNQKIDEPIATAQGKQSTETAAQMTGTNRQYVADAKIILREAPEKIEEIMAGRTTIPKVIQEIKFRKTGSVPEFKKVKGNPSITPFSACTDAMQDAVKVITQLDSIPKDDPQRVPALLRVRDYIIQQLAENS